MAIGHGSRRLLFPRSERAESFPIADADELRITARSDELELDVERTSAKGVSAGVGQWWERSKIPSSATWSNAHCRIPESMRLARGSSLRGTDQLRGGTGGTVSPIADGHESWEDATEVR